MAADTKERILDAAEHLFADHGFPATSLRDITQEAGVNLAAVNYHFGSKEALLIAVLDRKIAPVNRARLTQLAALEAGAGNDPVPTEHLVRAFLTPLFETWHKPDPSVPKFLKLVGRLHAEVDQDLRTKFIKRFDTVVQQFAAAFHRGLPYLSATEVQWRVLFLIGSMAYTITWGGSIITMGGEDAHDPEDVFEALIQFATAGMGAPVLQGVAVASTRRSR
ncbi:MAG: TetR/AcrR family transcriptional regulator [Acidobacteria bacterium]|nr:TetR/AcrR family transcriptional regulator [Acidobacteriota bacterium]